MIKIKLNGKEITTQAGKTILEVAKEHNINIPTLCHDEELKPYGSCFVCAVEVKGRRGFVTSCGTEVYDGMEVNTNTEEIIAARKLALELLLSDHYADCEAPCKIACPAHIDVQGYVAYIANGQYQEAVKLIKEQLPMPLSIGRVCPAFCETECRRQIVDEPIAIRQLKRHAADFDLVSDWSYIPEKEEAKNKKIAIIGAGPSGLTCGYYLSNKGYEVKVFERSEKPGGWLRYGIPEYRLPKEILDKEIQLMCANGMEILTNVDIGKDFSLKEISEEFDAVYMALGAQNAVPMRVKGSDLDGCYLGVDFLKDVVMGKEINLGKRVAIIGGGNTAIDCARTARRKGADVTLIYRRTRLEMPAEAYEVDAAEEEGVTFHFLTNPVEYIGVGGRLDEIKFEKMKLGAPDSSGRRRPEPTGEYFIEAYDSVIAAISQSPDVDFLLEEKNKINGEVLPLSRWSTIEVDKNTMYTGIKNIFGGGDFQRGPATAVEAIADGKIAAEKIDAFLQGEELLTSKWQFDSKKGKTVKDVDPKEYEIFEKIPRFKMPELEPEDRITNFKEVETGFSDEDAMKEADRCLECGCQVNSTCSLRTYATEYQVDTSLLMGDKNKHPIDNNHLFIQRDANKCINCGRCVRICAEVQGPGVLGYIYRGFKTLVAPEFNDGLSATTCESCGKCIEVCPVGALLPNNDTYKLSHLEGEKTVQNCGICGVGCLVEISTFEDQVATIQAPKEQGFNGRNICFAGRFGWQMLQEDRLSSPMIKDKNEIKEICWEEAGKILEEKIKSSQSKRIYVSPRVTNEEMLLMKVIGDKIGATIESFEFKNSFEDQLFNKGLTNKNYEELSSAEAIVIIGEIGHTARILARNAQRKGTKLISINNKRTAFDDFADVYYNSDDYISILQCLSHHNSESKCLCGPDCAGQANKENDKLPQKTIFLYNHSFINEKTAFHIWKLAEKICDFSEGSGVISGTSWNNYGGMRLCGFESNKIQKSDLVILYGEQPFECMKEIEDCDFVVSFDTHTEVNQFADLSIPAPSYLEIFGTAFAEDGKIKEFKNPTNSKIFDDILEIFNQINLLDAEQINPRYWRNEIDAKNFNFPSFDKTILSKILSQNYDLKDRIYRREDNHLKKIKELKKQIKE